MVAYKAARVPRFLKSPDPNCKAVLVYGPDAGLVSERAAALAGTFARRSGPDAEIIRLDDRDFAEDPARLDIELRTQPMFASAKVVRVTAGNRLDVPSLKALLAEPSDNALIVEAGNLRPDAGLRKLFEKLPDAAALPSYADERDLAGVIDGELADAGLTIDRETKARFRETFEAQLDAAQQAYTRWCRAMNLDEENVTELRSQGEAYTPLSSHKLSRHRSI